MSLSPPLELLTEYCRLSGHEVLFQNHTDNTPTSLEQCFSLVADDEELRVKYLWYIYTNILNHIDHNVMYAGIYKSAHFYIVTDIFVNYYTLSFCRDVSRKTDD